MVANRARGTKKRKGPPLDANGHPIMQGVDVSFSEDPAEFWGPNWQEDLAAAEEEYHRSPKHVFSSLEEFFADLDATT